METNQIYFNAREIADKLGVSRSGIYSLMKSSQFPAPIKIGRLSRWKVTEVMQWLKAREATNEAHA